MRKRIGNDIEQTVSVTLDGLAVDLGSVEDLVVVLKHRQAMSINVSPNYDIVGGNALMYIEKEVLTELGKYYYLITYKVADANFDDGYQHYTIDVDAFEIVPRTAEEYNTDQTITAAAIAGLRGNGIESIDLTDTVGLVKTYTITYTDGTTDTFDVTDGADGHSPVITFVGTTIYVDGVAGADLKGDKGDAFTYDDFTPEQIETLQQPAIDAAAIANTAAVAADDARIAIQDDLALKADQNELDRLAGDVERLAYVKIKNEVVNGNFENGLIAPLFVSDGFGGESTFAINISSPISGNYDVRLTITTPATAAGRPLFGGLHKAANIGDKIYLHFYAKILSGTPNIYGINNGAGTAIIYGGNVINGRNTRIIDVGGTGYAGLIYFNSMSDVWDMQMDNFMRINLTETFGAGNEPTEEEMNLLLDKLPVDYLEGEYVVPQEIIFKRQLALLAIQDDLALKANLTDLAQLAGEVTDKLAIVNDEIYGSDSVIETKTGTVGLKRYYNFGTTVDLIGTAYPYNVSSSYSEAVQQYTAFSKYLNIGDKVKLSFFNSNVGSRQRPYIIVSEDSIIIGASTNGVQMLRANPIYYTATQKCAIYALGMEYNAETDGIFLLNDVHSDGINDKIKRMDSIPIGAHPFVNKEVFTIGDSLCTSGLWQKVMCDIIGASFDNSKNIDASSPISAGGTSMYGNKKEMGLVRATNLLKMGYNPDVIILENVNDRSAFYFESGAPLLDRTGHITDKAYVVNKIIDNIATDADWEANATAILQAIPINDRLFGTMITISSISEGKNVKPVSLPTANGNIKLTIEHGGLSNNYVLSVNTSDTVHTICQKILEYDYAGISDTLADDLVSVNFSGDNVPGIPRIFYEDTDSTGLTFDISDTSAAKQLNGKFFDGQTLDEWGDQTKWIDSITLYRAWKGVIEFCAQNFPLAKLYIAAFLSKGSISPSTFILPNGIYDSDAYEASFKCERALVTALKNIGDLYGIPVLDLANNQGIVAANVLTYFPDGSIHPLSAGYTLWGEKLASLILAK